MTPALDSLALLSALSVYQRQIVPEVHAEQRRWERAGAEMPDPTLREAALSALREKGHNAEATAVFAILSPRRHRAGAVRAMTALQTAIDYLDTLGEQPVEDPLANGLALHEALQAALSADAATPDWYRLNPQREDGGYLAALAGACCREIAALPERDAILPAAQRAIRRCGEGQSHTHAAAAGDSFVLEGWAADLPVPAGYLWWETAAGACSSVATHALIAAGADPRTSAAEVEAIEATYFPPVGALTVLLDDLVDREADAAAAEHNYMAYYASNDMAADRLAAIAERARSAAAELRDRAKHAAILAGVTGFYLSAPTASGDYASPIRARMLESLGGTARLAMAAMRLRRRG